MAWPSPSCCPRWWSGLARSTSALNRNDVPVIYDEAYAPSIGKAHLVRAGRDVTIFANGQLLCRAWPPPEMLAAEGLSAQVVEMHTVKPLDVEAVVQAVAATGAIVTAEEHTIVGGLGGAVAEVVAERCPAPVKRVGLADRFAETGPYDALLDRYGMAVADIVTATREAVVLKRK